MKKQTSVLLIFIIFVMISCQFDPDDKKEPLFQLLSPARTGVDFINALSEDHQMNVILYQDFYSGGGVAIGDINNDNWPDVLLTGNMVPAKLFLNQGNLKFKDVTLSAGLTGMGRGWFTGTTMVDINNDGYLDIFIGKSGLEDIEDRKNLLFINQGDGTFLENGHEFGLDHAGYAVNATFFDYDNDHDLDMYLVNQGPEKYQGGDSQYMRNEKNEFAGDKLYENVGNRFVDVTQESGIFSSIIGFAHGVAAGDINDDGWEDLFVSNDFFEHDYIYINNGDKTFREITKKATKHISYYSMGNDMADFNNDGLLDVVVLDMVAEDNQRLKENLGGMKDQRFEIALRLGYHYQYMFNMLHLSNGNETFSEIGQLAGISRTDWSWAPVFADFDNDGWKDLYISNGIRKDIRNIDWGDLFSKERRKTAGELNFDTDQWDLLLSSMPSKKVSNYMYKNNGDLTFSKVTEDWGLDYPSFSNGFAYGDLDKDGDLDLVVNNINDQAFVYENKSRQDKSKHFLRIKFIGSEKNKLALGTKVRIHHQDNFQYQQHYVTRGYRSSMEPVMHFGLGTDSLINHMEVIWPDGRTNTIKDIRADQILTLNIHDAENKSILQKSNHTVYFTDMTDSVDLNFKHIENEYDDFLREPLLQHKYSASGPALASGDVNGDGLDDFFIGGSFRHPGALFLQKSDGSFESIMEDLWQQERLFEDAGAVFFDVDNDNDLDLYVVSGGNEFKVGSEYLQDRLYINNGYGKFIRDSEALPVIEGCGSRAIPADFDQDGDMDIFIGGRLVPGNYPAPADSYLLENKKGKFDDVSDEIAPQLRRLGMVTDAIWTDIDMDTDLDLIIVGEWMPITIFENTDGKFNRKVNENNGLEKSSGWWSSIVDHDFDGDGDQDIVVGNFGLNYKYKASVKYPFELFYTDFDGNNKKEIVFTYYQDGRQYPVVDRMDLISVIPNLEEKFPKNDTFSKATLSEIFNEEVLRSAMNYQAFTFATSFIENLGNNTFNIIPFDNLVQISNQNAIILEDVDSDGKMDIIMAGNQYATEVETIRNDAGIGILLKGNGSRNFKSIMYQQSGLFADGDIKNMRLLNTNRGKIIVCAKNDDYIQFIGINQK